MDLSRQEGENIPIPISSTYGGGHGHEHVHMIHHEPTPPHNHIMAPSSNGPITPGPEDHMPYKKVARYRECLKNHVAAMGGNATDGCGEFMPSGEEGTLEALKCLACNCHRNFHRKEVEGESSCDCYHHPYHLNLNRVGLGRKLILSPRAHKGGSMLGPSEALAGGLIHSSRAAQVPSHHMLMSYNSAWGPASLPSESDEQERPPQLAKKRFRTKFTQEQKEKMLNFAEKVGWRMQKQEEALVQQFCQEIGIRRRVLKVWMHNNKHNLGKKKNAAPSS